MDGQIVEPVTSPLYRTDELPPALERMVREEVDRTFQKAVSGLEGRLLSRAAVLMNQATDTFSDR